MVHTAQRQIKKLNPWELRAAMADPAYRRELIEYYYQLHAQTTTPGSVVEYLQQGHPVCGVILMVGAREHHIKDIDGKVHLVPLERIADVSSLFIGTTYAGHDTVLLLRTIHEEREALKATIDLDTLWEVTESERRPWSLDELAALYYHDDAGAHGKAALFRALVENGLFRREGKAFVPVARERANIYRERQHQRGKDDAWLHDAAHWLRALVDGQPATPPADAERILQLLAAHVLHGERRQHESEATALIHLAHFHTLHAIFDALVAAGYWQRDENLDILRYATPTTFAAETLAEAKVTRWRIRQRDIPVLAGRPVYAFAGGHSHYARAFSIRTDRYGFTVGIHLASPALRMRAGGKVQREAIERAQALTLPDQEIPLLPLEITGRTALTTGEARPCLTLTLRFSRDYTLLNWRFEISRVQVTHPCDRAGADDVGLRRLHALALHQRDRRYAAGAVIISEPEIAVHVEGGEISLRTIEPDAPGVMIDRELAILANMLAGQWCMEQQIPALYRVESPPAAILVAPDQFDPVAGYRQKQLLPRALLQTEPAPHAGVGAAVYLPISNPARCCTDLLMHQQLIRFLEDGHAIYSSDDLHTALEQTATASLIGPEIETNARRYWLLRYLERQSGAMLDAVILERFSEGYLIELAETRLTVYGPAAALVALHPGTQVQVRLQRAAARMDVLQVRFVSS